MRSFLVCVIVFYLSLPGIVVCLRRLRILVCDPGNPSFFEQAFCEDRWIRGSSPRMTVNPRFGAASIQKRISLVFRALQDTRPHDAADELSDWHRVGRPDLAGHALCVPRPQACDLRARAARDLRLFAA